MKFWQFWENLVGIISTGVLSHSLSLLRYACLPYSHMPTSHGLCTGEFVG